MKRGEVLKKIEWGIEEFILLSIILLNILDVLEIISPDLDYIKKIISWSALGILVYNASPSKIFVGFRKPSMDIVLILAYFLMTIKNLVSYAYVAISSSSSFLRPLYVFLIENATTIEITGLFMGLFLILFVCINLSLRTPLLKPSLLHLMRADKIKHDWKTFLLHFSSLLFISLGFFLVFFNLIMEWLAIAIDAPLLMIGLVPYFFIIIKHREHFSTGSFLRKFGDFGNDFYKGILEHLRYKRAFLRVVSGMLILHILTDMFTFLWHYFFGISDPLYLGLIGPHPTLFELMRIDLLVSWMSGFIHISNAIALFFLMIAPILIWFSLYFHKTIKPTNQLTILISFCLFVFILNPVFKISMLNNSLIYGVDILGVGAQTYQIIPFGAVLIISLFITLLLAKIHLKTLQTINVLAGKLFFVLYSLLFFFSIGTYYLNIIPLLLQTNIFISFIFTIFFIITSMFYIIGIGSFLIDSHKHLDEHVL